MVRSLSAAVVALAMLLGLAVPSSIDCVVDQASAMVTATSIQQAQGKSVLADDVADVSVAPAAYMMTDDPWDNAAARFIAWAGGCANVSITSWTAYQKSMGLPQAAAASTLITTAAVCSIGVGQLLGNANVAAICWQSRQWWGWIARGEVWAWSLGKFTRC